MGKQEKLIRLIKNGAEAVSSEHLIAPLQTWLGVSDVMNRNVVTICPNETVAEASKIMAEHNISCIIAEDRDNVVGILTETDILEKAVAGKKSFDKISVAEIMSFPVQTITTDLSVLEASKIMAAKHIKQLPILKEKRLAGIITQTDLVQALTLYGMRSDISEIMNPDVVGIQRKAVVAEAARVMTSNRISCIVVLEGNEAVGVLTKRDILKKVVALKKDPCRVELEEVMSSPVISVPYNYSVFSTSRIMEQMHTRRLVVTDEKGLCGIVTQTDIFKAVKSKLTAEEEKNIRLLEKSKNCIFLLDHDGKTSYVNPAFMNLLEVGDGQEIINQPFLPERFWFNPEQREVLLAELRKGNVKAGELTLKTSKGKKVVVTVFPAFTKDLHGEINGSQGILYDITPKKELAALKEAEKSLRKSEEKYRSLITNIPDVTWTADSEGNTTFISPNVEKIYGYSPEEVYKQPDKWFERIHPDDAERVRQAFKALVETGTMFNVEYRIKRKDNTWVWVHDRSIVAYERNGAMYADGVFSDITDRKQVEEELTKAWEEMKRFNRLAVGRELRMIELKHQINELCRELGREEKYPLANELAGTHNG